MADEKVVVSNIRRRKVPALGGRRQQELPPVQVFLTEAEDGTVAISGLGEGEEAPPLAAVREKLPEKARKLVERRLLRYFAHTGNLEQAISRTKWVVSLQQWADAIAEAVMWGRMGGGRTAVEARLLAPVQTEAYLAFGDTVYKLSPVEVGVRTTAVAAARKLVIEKAKDTAGKIVEAAKQAAVALVEDGKKKRAEAAEVLRREREKDWDRPPQWMVEKRLEIRACGGGVWAVRCWVQFCPEGFDLDMIVNGKEETVSWPVRELESDGLEDSMRKPVTTSVWVKVRTSTGEYALSACGLDRQSVLLPHINYDGACFELGDGPGRIESAEDFDRFKEALQRCFTRVNLSSLYTPSRDWLPGMKDWVPEGLYQVLWEANGTSACRRPAADLARRTLLKERLETPTPNRAAANGGGSRGRGNDTWTLGGEEIDIG